MLQGFKAEEATPHRMRRKCMQSEKEKDNAFLWTVSFKLVFLMSILKRYTKNMLKIHQHRLIFVLV